MKACPKCKSTSRKRMRRKYYIKLIPGTKSYSCDYCNKYYTWLPFFNISICI